MTTAAFQWLLAPAAYGEIRLMTAMTALENIVGRAYASPIMSPNKFAKFATAVRDLIRQRDLPESLQTSLPELNRYPLIEKMTRYIDRIFTDCPVYGSRRLQVALLREGISMGRRRVRRLMRKLGLWAVRPKRNTTKRHPGHKVYPYLLRGKTIDRANQVWAADITYIPMRQGFLYLVAIIDWATRRVLSWRLSNTLTARFCVEALSEALAWFGKPGIFNTDQGAQFTSDEFTKMLTDHGIAISMDGRGRCHDNIFVERLWWTVKHEWVYLRPAANGIEQKRSLGEFFDWYNLRRPHQALGWRTPDEAYLGQSTAATALAA